METKLYSRMGTLDLNKLFDGCRKIEVLLPNQKIGNFNDNDMINLDEYPQFEKYCSDIHKRLNAQNIPIGTIVKEKSSERLGVVKHSDSSTIGIRFSKTDRLTIYKCNFEILFELYDMGVK